MLKFYNINDDYVNYLRKKECRIMDKNKDRIKIGVVFSINNLKYYAPLSNIDKSKNKYFKNEKEIVEAFSWNKRIGIIYDEKDSKIALIRYDYMLPVPDKEIEEVDRNKLNGNYKKKVENDYKYCNLNKKLTEETALEIYKVRTISNLNEIMKEINWCGKRKELKKYKEDLEHPSSGTCDFKKIEIGLTEWIKMKDNELIKNELDTWTKIKNNNRGIER
ncbi:MAG: type III toxin-antitoxin system ToxN/AbiQ family toxin [Fusobacteriaceae bacterium]